MTQNKSGEAAVIEMLQVMDPTEREKLLGNLAKQDPALVTRLRDGLVTFDNLATLPDLEMQALLREVPQPKLALALRKTTDDVKEAVLRSMSERARQILKEEMDVQGPQKISEVKKAQREIIEIAKQLEGQGKLLLRRPT